MSAKKKKQSNSPLRVIIILVLLGLLAYKHQLFDGKLLENIPTIESNEEKPEILTSPQHGGALEIPMTLLQSQPEKRRPNSHSNN